LTGATKEQISNVDNYIKKPSLLDYALESPGYRAKDLILKEARICEILLSKPHPNIVDYHGVVEEGGLIRGLCFVKLPRTLSQCMGLSFAAEFDMGNIDVEKCLSGIAGRIAHLHSLGLVHNDINLGNIMLRDDSTPVIIDFDSCEWEGAKPEGKMGTFPWDEGHSLDVAKRENDLLAFKKIAEALREAKLTGEPPVVGDDI